MTALFLLLWKLDLKRIQNGNAPPVSGAHLNIISEIQHFLR